MMHVSQIRNFAMAIFSVLLAGTQSFAAVSKSPFTNLRDIAERAGFIAYQSEESDRTVKIAILDNGFRGYKKELGKTLPANTKYHAGPVAVPEETEESHGLAMAQVITGLMAYTPGISYELHLFSAFGYSNLESAVTKVIKDEFDIVLYAQVWEYGGNGDGRGFINKLVNRATQAGILWINAAGNFGDSTFRTMVEAADDDWARLPGPNQSVRVRCKTNSKKACQLRAVLSWNDFKDDMKEGTDKDLDFVLTDDTLKIIRSAGLTQKKEFPEGEPGSSLYPREIIQAELKPGLYYLRVKIRSQNFDENKDQLRITTSGDFIELEDKVENDTLLSPADNKSVITVGASDSEKSATGAKGQKPELVFASILTLKNGENYKGSSNSSAIAAAAAIVLKGLRSSLDKQEFLSLLSVADRPVGSEGDGLELRDLRFYPTGDECFEPANLEYVPRHVAWVLSQGGVSVMTSAGVKIFTTQDPLYILPELFRIQYDDMIVATPNGFDIYPRTSQPYLRRGVIEIVQKPRGQRICGSSKGRQNGSDFMLPNPSDLGGNTY